MDGLISFFRKFLRRQRGSMAVEFGILVPVFVLLIFGIVDFGHAWYMKMEVTSASREGARYGTRFYDQDTTPYNLNPSISTWVTNAYTSLLPSNANLQVTPAGPGYSSSSTRPNLTGTDLTVTVTATKYWFVLGYLIPGMGTSKAISATTDMKVE
jgi:Flp pilus assembly protein TadG